MPKDQTQCGSCSKPSKYKCPRCLAPSCSMLCVQTHKTTSNCSGIRDKTQYVSLRTFDSSQLASDFAFLEGGARVADNAARDTIHTSETQPTHSKLTPKQQHLLRNCSSRKITLRFMPRGMSRHESNQSMFHIKSKTISWTAEFIFTCKEGNVRVSTIQSAIKESATLKDTLVNLLSPKSSAIPPEKLCQLNRFSGAPVDALFVYLRREHVPANEPLYHTLKPHATILESLTKKVIVEYPTFLVCLDALEQRQVVADVVVDAKPTSDAESPSVDAVVQLEVGEVESETAEVLDEQNHLEAGVGLCLDHIGASGGVDSSLPQIDDSHVEVADMNGQVTMAFPVMERAVHMAMLLQLDHDPDDVESLRETMTEKDKEDWRRTFWVFNHGLKTMRLDAGPDVYVFTPQGITVCGLVDVLQEILDFVRTPPPTLMDLFGHSKIKIAYFEAKLPTFHAQAPARLVIDPPTLTWTCLNCTERGGMIVLFMYHRAALCSLYRPTIPRWLIVLLAEVSQQDDFAAKEAPTSSADSASVNSLVFEMQVLSMEATVAVDVVQQNRSPWVLLGLLGVDVGGKFRWGAAYEAAWKEFWESEALRVAFCYFVGIFGGSMLKRILVQ
ncbi:hypothetical protein BJ741DRAFT_670616 [Chytriomyces cf. hyalinus JEL632]|nr:hypothetical protein BJ741DRAFT_670616 [Chytriomyces cf. hyalinus JEL632]